MSGLKTTVWHRTHPLDRMISLHQKNSQPAKMPGLKTTVCLCSSPLDRMIPFHRKSSQPAKMPGLKMMVCLCSSPLERMIPLHQKSSRAAKMLGLKTTDQGMMVSPQSNLRWNHPLTLSFSELCQGFTLARQLCQKKVKTGRYCHVHGGREAHTWENEKEGG